MLLSARLHVFKGLTIVFAALALKLKLQDCLSLLWMSASHTVLVFGMCRLSMTTCVVCKYKSFWTLNMWDIQRVPLRAQWFQYVPDAVRYKCNIGPECQSENSLEETCVHERIAARPYALQCVQILAVDPDLGTAAPWFLLINLQVLLCFSKCLYRWHLGSGV